MRNFSEVLDERKGEIKKHLDLIMALEVSAGSASAGGHRISVDHINIVKGGFVVHLYNVVEAVMSQVCETIALEAKIHSPSKWNRGLIEEWARVRVNPKKDINYSSRVERTVKLMEEMANRVAIGSVRIENSSGNWSCDEIVHRASSLGCVLNIPDEIKVAACETVFEDNLAPIKYVRHMRNRLAHGNVSFLHVLASFGHSDLERLANAVLDYMLPVCSSFEAYLDTNGYLETEKK